MTRPAIPAALALMRDTGLGVEDLAVMYGVPADSLRAAIADMRRRGVLDAFLRSGPRGIHHPTRGEPRGARTATQG